jgi:hypothetical protein
MVTSRDKSLPECFQIPELVLSLGGFVSFGDAAVRLGNGIGDGKFELHSRSEADLAVQISQRSRLGTANKGSRVIGGNSGIRRNSVRIHCEKDTVGCYLFDDLRYQLFGRSLQSTALARGLTTRIRQVLFNGQILQTKHHFVETFVEKTPNVPHSNQWPWELWRNQNAVPYSIIQ